MEQKIVKFKQWECVLEYGEYYNGNNALQLVDKDTGENILTASVNLDVTIPKDKIMIKDYSENEGILQALIDAGVIGKPEVVIPSGYIYIPVCTLLDRPPEEE